MGQYCPYASTGSINCPNGTYNALLGQSLITSCLPCPPGYLCDAVGIPQYKTYPCPVGNVCLQNSTLIPTKCPGGTYLDSVGGAKLSDCHICPGTIFLSLFLFI